MHQMEHRIGQLMEQLHFRMQIPLRSYFVTETFEGIHRSYEILERVVELTERSYFDFLSTLSQSKMVQFADNQNDLANRILPKPGEDSSYDHAVRLLKRLIDETNGSPLLEALEVYLECGAKMQMAAEKLYLHRNTLRYRLKRVEKLLGINLEDDQTRFTYQLAIRTWRLRNPNIVL